ncbi:MAG: amidohydrolase family protein [Spirochaetaceae bacterium]|jgi:predicted TIM-barrel fold metal-dependent hydrolase|nr:amidohydrolase family protein [Spirochaetaceae bacterium]
MKADNHLHIGQFCETYYDPLEILRIVAEAGITDAVYSSTTSGKDDVCYTEVEREIAAVTARYPADRYEPFLWYIPPYIDEGISVERAFQDLPYGGIKLHPRAHRWDLHNKKHLDCLHTLFGYAGNNNVPVLIHTGEDDFERPVFFSPFFSQYPDVRFILAHCRPTPDTIAMFRSHGNVYGDTAFLDAGRYNQIAESGFAGRLVPGTDFPITHYFNKDSGISLERQYAEDLERLELMVL